MSVAHTNSHVTCTVTGLAVAGSSRKLIGLGGANGMAGRGLRVTWAAGEAEWRKQSCYTHTHTHRNTHTRTLAARYDRFQEAGSDTRPDKRK